LAASRSATERDQREFARVATALYRHDARGFDHAGVDDFDNPRGRFVNGEPERIDDTGEGCVALAAAGPRAC
jgi:hypothetical protein